MTIREKNELQLKTFCDNIAILRKRHNLSYSKMAKILHTTVKSLKSIENGEIPSRVRIDIIINAIEFFKYDSSNLFVEKLGE